MQVMVMEPMRIELTGYDVVEKKATRQGNSAHVLIPPSWIGKRVKAILLESVDDTPRARR